MPTANTKDKPKRLSPSELRTLADLEERRAATEHEHIELVNERTEKIKTLDELLKHVDRAVEAKTTSAAEAATADIRKDIGNLVDTVNGMVGDINKLAGQEREVANGGIGYDHERATETERRTGSKTEKFSLSRAIGGFTSGWQGDYAKCPEREMIEAYAKRSLQLGVSSAGGFLVAPQWMSDVIELLRPNLVAAVLGARFRPLTGPVNFRKIAGGATSYWTAEGKKATKSEPSYGKISLTPKPLVTLVPISEDLLAMGPSGMEGDIEEDMARSQAETLDESIMKGDGGEGEPIGMVNIAGGTTDFSDIDYGGTLQNVTDKLDDLMYAIGARNVRGAVGLAMNPLAIQKLRTTKDLDGNTVIVDSHTVDPQAVNGGVETGRLWGMRYATSTQLAYGTTNDDIIAAVWREILIGQFGATEIRPSFDASDPTDNTSAFMQREVWIRMTARWDAALRYAEAVQLATGWDNS